MHPAVIRLVEAQDITPLYEINEAAVPGVSSVTREALTRLVFDFADVIFVAVQNQVPVGFVLCLIEGQQAYNNLNYAWISDHYVTFAYVDRIAVAKTARGMGIGGQLYEKVFLHYNGRRPVLMAEVYLKPPNPGSLRFHRRMGFRSTGIERWEKDGSKGVVFLERSLLGGGD